VAALLVGAFGVADAIFQPSFSWFVGQVILAKPRLNEPMTANAPELSRGAQCELVQPTSWGPSASTPR
jgi:hypothetical protein